MDTDAGSAIAEMAEQIETLNENVERMTEILETISDGLFYLNLHLDAEVKPWTGGR